MTEPMLALSIRQSIAWAIIHADKDVENLSENTRRRAERLIGQTVPAPRLRPRRQFRGGLSAPGWAVADDHRSAPPSPPPPKPPGLAMAPPTGPPLAGPRPMTARLKEMGPTPGLMALIAGATGELKFGRTGVTRGATTTAGARLMTFTPFGWPKTMIPPAGLLLELTSSGRRSSVDEIAGPGSTADEVAARARVDEVAG